MSSETPTSQQLYEAERRRALTLEKRNVRLQAELVELKTECDRLETVETESEIREQDKDATIQQLQTALDNADRPSASGDVKEVLELRAKIKLLEAMHKDAHRKLKEGARGDWSGIKPLLDQQLRKERNTARMQSRELGKELVRTRAELTEVRALKDALLFEFENLVAETESHTRIQAAKNDDLDSAIEQVDLIDSLIGPLRDSLAQQLLEGEDSSSKLEEASDAAWKRLDLHLTKLRPVTEDSDIESSESHNTRFQASEDTKGQGRLPPELLLQAARKGKVAEEGTGEPRGTNDEGFSTAAKGISTSVVRGSIQDCSTEQAASRAPRVPKSSAELELLRLKDRRTLHRLDLF